ncbi:uncharacterized protein LOC110029711 [Phalaenopsis equestris]|uniref:uncharacterized protein LOC110029711 n=1 Tax=Phalaenopsis equestris TaxID=78828 RepID=UPI0009E5E3D6|nr:uncharacterized protein LOC110029711 [Phalaenopsis equestris]
MLGCKLAVSPIDQGKLSVEVGKPVDRVRYHRLVGPLIYLCHTRRDISFAVNVVSRYMHDLRKCHIDAIYQILRSLESASGKGLIIMKNRHVSVEGYCDFEWAGYMDDRISASGYYMFVGSELVPWKSKK